MTVDHKGDDLQDVVSVADKRVEAFVKQRIQSAFPEDGFLGEERRPPARRASAVVVDPSMAPAVSSTACTRCLSLAIVADGEPVIGVVYDPNHRELFHALRPWRGSTTLRSVRTRDDGQRGRDGRRHLASRHPADFLPFLQALLSDGGMFIRNGSGALMSAGGGGPVDWLLRAAHEPVGPCRGWC